MPLTNHNSYVPTMNEIIAHWSQVNAALTYPVTVSSPTQSSCNIDQFTDLREELQDRFQEIIGYLNDREIARGSIRINKAAMLAHFNEFNAMLDGYWSATPFHNARPYAPSISDGLGTFLAPMRDCLSLWGKLNAAPAPAGITLPLQLSDGTTVAEFASAITSLQADHAAEADANQNAVLARSQRDNTMANAKALMVSYRKVIPARCAQHPALVETLPTITPAPGHTPDPVNATAQFVAPASAKISYDASRESTIVRYELRGNPGATYDEDSAMTLDSRNPTESREFITSYGLSLPGSQLALKVYVILASGNEAGSAPMVITRPM